MGRYNDLGKELKEFKVSRRKIKKIVVHTSANKFTTKKGALYIHEVHKKNGWRGCGYHYVVPVHSPIQIGMDVDYVGIHAKGFNKKSIGVCYMGGLDKNLVPRDNILSVDQYTKLVNLVAQLVLIYKEAEVIGHNELPNVRKACPCLDMDKFREDVSIAYERYA